MRSNISNCTSRLMCGISSSLPVIINTGTSINGAVINGEKATSVLGITRVMLFFQPVFHWPPWSINQRKAWMGVSKEGFVCWSEDTTAMGPSRERSSSFSNSPWSKVCLSMFKLFPAFCTSRVLSPQVAAKQTTPAKPSIRALATNTSMPAKLSPHKIIFPLCNWCSDFKKVTASAIPRPWSQGLIVCGVLPSLRPKPAWS